MCWERQHLRYLLLTTAQRVRGGGNMWALQRCVSTCCQTEGRARKHSWYWYWSSFKYSVLIFNWIFNHQWTQIGQRTVHTEAVIFVQINTCRLSGCYVTVEKAWAIWSGWTTASWQISPLITVYFSVHFWNLRFSLLVTFIHCGGTLPHQRNNLLPFGALPDPMWIQPPQDALASSAW